MFNQQKTSVKSNEKRKLGESGSVREFTFEHLLISTFIALVKRYTDLDEIEIAVRFPLTEIGHDGSNSPMLGAFDDGLCLRIDMSSDMSFDDLANVVSCSKPHQAIQTDASQDRNCTYVFEIKFRVYKDWDNCLPADVQPVITIGEDARITAKPSIDLVNSKEHLICTLRYPSDLTHKTIGENLFLHFRSLLRNARAHPDKKISAIEMLDAADFCKMVYQHNSTSTPYPRELCLHQLIERQAAETPSAIALIQEERTITYAQLNDKANVIAYYLIQLGIRPDDSVAVYIDLSIEAVIAILGVLKAGGAYVPLVSDCPPSRLQYIINHSKPKALLIQKIFLDGLDFDSSCTLVVDDVLLKASIRTNPVTSVAPCNLAYIMYTSGSTGPPKGVMIEHGNVVNNMMLIQKRYELTEKDTVLSMPSLAFDASVSKLFPILTLGGAALLPKPEDVIDVDKLMELIKQYKIPYFACTPSILRVFNAMKPDLSMLRMVTSGGESLRYSDVDNIIKHVPVLNVYGPTEATVSSTSFRIEKNALKNDPGKLNEPVPIGKPNPNCKIYILDQYLNPLPEGCFGTLYIGGVGVGRGYLNEDALTQEKFITNPFAPAEKMYNTGDIARWLPDGNIDFLGRRDNLVKIRGCRVSLEEIEESILGHRAIQSCKMILKKNNIGDEELLAFVVLKTGMTATPEELRDLLKGSFPSYMLPGEFIVMDSLPLNHNKKVDSRALCDAYETKMKNKLKPILT